MRTMWGVTLSLFIAGAAAADVRLPGVFSDHLVLQRESKVAVWGWSDAGEAVKVTGSWPDAKPAEAKADGEGNWRVELATGAAGGPFELTVAGKNSLTVNDVLLGEVWVCSGQSNMEWSVGPAAGPGVANFEVELKTADRPQIRLFHVPHNKQNAPQKDVAAKWAICSPDSVKDFSGVGYFFGRKLQEELKVPIGLIQTTWGGTPVEFWMSEPAMRAIPDLAVSIDKRKSAKGEQDWAVLYNGMIAPLVPYGIRGFIWYQGESNAKRAYQYRTSFAAMIRQWRGEWGRGELPFYFVQIAPFDYTVFEKQVPMDWGHPSAELREAQLMTLTSVPNTGMAVTTDITDNVKDIHPKNKQDVGVRLARWALARDYGHKDVVASGPVYKSMKVEGDAIRLSFDHLGGGLACKGDKLSEFNIAGADRKFVAAEAKIDGDTIVVRSAEVRQPAAVRFGWADTSIPNLFNKAGLPASPFRTDDWPGMTADAKW